MRLSIKENHAVNKIIEKLSEEEIEYIRKNVECLYNLKKQNPLFDAISNYEPSDFTKIADEWLSLSDVDYQILMSESLWDALTARLTREYAISVFIEKMDDYEVH